MAKKIKMKFAYGGTAMNIDSPSVSLVKAKRNTEQASLESQFDPLVMGLQGLGGTMMGAGLNMATMGINKMGGYEKLFDTIFGGNKAATGGTFGSQVEAEGGEVVETPDGQMQQLQGPSHEGGGIDMLVPPGTDFFSDRLKGPNGKTMADRKKERELKEAKLQKQLQKDPTNILLKKTLKKVQEDNAKINEQDLAQMNYVKDMMSHGDKFAWGGTKKPKLPNTLEALISPSPKGVFDGTNYLPYYDEGEDPNNPVALKFQPPGISIPGIDWSKVEGPREIISDPKAYNQTQDIQGTPSNSSMPTLGDMFGMAGNLISGFGPLSTTLKNRANTPIEKNAYENFGQKGLAKIQGQSQFIDGVRTNQLQDLELGRQASINRNNNSARGLNTQRALNLAVDAQANNTRANINDQFAQSMMQMMGLEANQLNAMDQAVMQGEDKRAERELQNTDNFYSNMARDIASMGQGVAMTGKSLNNVKERDASMNVLRQIFPDFAVDRDGNTIVKENGQVTQVDTGTANVKENGTTKETKTVEPLYDKDGNMSKEGLAKLMETPELYSNFKGKDGKAITPEEFAKYLYSKATNPKYTLPLEELDTTYKTKIDPEAKIKGSPFESFEDYQNAIKANRILEDIKKASTSTKKKTTTKKYKRK